MLMNLFSNGLRSLTKMKQLIAEKIWDEDLKESNPRAWRVRTFEGVRDIPFAVVPAFFARENGVKGMLLARKGFCVPKHYFLGEMCVEKGVPVRYRAFSFYWKDLAAGYPEALRELANALPVTYHLACEMFIGNKWVFTDATWDAPLKIAGFGVNEKWDGVSDTENAVKPLDEIGFERAEEHERWYASKLAEYTASEKRKLLRFSVKLNTWLEIIRSKKND